MPRFGGVSPAGGTDTVVYTAPANKRVTITVNICNTSQFNIFAFLGLTPSGSSSISPTDYIEYNTNIAPGNTLERTSITPYNGEKVVVRASDAGLSVVVWGYEEP